MPAQLAAAKLNTSPVESLCPHKALSPFLRNSCSSSWCLWKTWFFPKMFLKAANGLTSYYRRDRWTEKSRILKLSRQKLERSIGDVLLQPGSARVLQGMGLPGDLDHGGWSPQGLAGQGLCQTRREQGWQESSREQPPTPGMREGCRRPQKRLVRAVTFY